MDIIRRLLLFLWLAMGTQQLIAEDIDLFASGLAGGSAASALPNILFVLDNTSNWSRQSQQWPEDTTQSPPEEVDQGQSEVRAIEATLRALLRDQKDANVGLIEFTTQGTANQNGGYVRFDMQPLGGESSELFSILDAIDEGINLPNEKRNSNSAYGNLASDIYAYLTSGAQSFAGQGTPSTLADATGYQDLYALFDSPLSESDVCSDTYVILISNTDSNGPEVDELDNSARLISLYDELGETPTAALAGQDGEGLPMQRYEAQKEKKNKGDQELIGRSTVSYTNAKACDEKVFEESSGESELISGSCVALGDCECEKSKEPGYTYDIYEATPLVQYGPASNDTIDGKDFNLDDWTKFLHDFGVPVVVEGTGGDSDSVVRIPVTTYTIDVFNRRPNEEHSALMHSAAEQGGGYRQSASNQQELVQALSRILGDIIDINTAFAAVTLPLSATNRAQAENKVFVGMFRPASQRKPRWLGNLKQYQLAKFDGQIELADANLNRAVNPQTGFAQSCATSFWTEDTTEATKAVGVMGPYFADLGLEPSPVSDCLSEFLGDRSVLSDSPDGPFVEKGGAAQQIRGDVNGTRTSARLIFTTPEACATPGTGCSLLDLGVDDFGSSEVFSYFIGEEAGLKGGDYKVPKIVDGKTEYEVNPLLGEEEEEPFAGLRPTIHGDIVHSRPLTITYGPLDQGDLAKGSDFRIFYGANDGLFRALDPATGQEDWALIASEHLDGIARLYANTPTVNYFGLATSLSTDIDAEPKRYFFDGSTGSYTEYDGNNELTTGWIFPTMRRGGRHIYALDISPTDGPGVPPIEPRFMWKFGPEDLTGLGQSWSTPVVGKVKVLNNGGVEALADPVLVFGGGWDSCLDADQAALPLANCNAGNQIIVLNARTGALLSQYQTVAPVVAEVSVLDIDNDGYLDFVYAADAAGNLYRLNFSKLDTLNDAYTQPLESSDWYLSHIAKSTGPAVRFLNKPTIGAIQNRVFVTIGSGDRERPLKQNYPYDDTSVSNRFYAFIDEPYGEQADPTNPIDLDDTTGERGMLNAANGLTESEILVDSYRGWFLELPDRGEQVVNPAAIGGGFVFFNSFQPEGGTKGFCSDLGKSKSYQVPLFRPQKEEGKEFGEGVPIPPTIVTVKLNSAEPSCSVSDCGEGEIPNEIVTVCIGCEGFNPIQIVPASDGTVREAYRAEDVDRL